MQGRIKSTPAFLLNIYIKLLINASIIILKTALCVYTYQYTHIKISLNTGLSELKTI